jgi:hypothetical protein
MSYWYINKYYSGETVNKALKAYLAKPKAATKSPAPAKKAVGYIISAEKSHNFYGNDETTYAYDHIPTSAELQSAADDLNESVEDIHVYRIDAEGEIEVANTVTFK